MEAVDEPAHQVKIIESWVTKLCQALVLGEKKSSSPQGYKQPGYVQQIKYSRKT